MKVFWIALFSGALLWGQDDYARQDALIFQASYYAPLDTLTMARYWEGTALRSESIYNGNGSWGLGYADWPNQPYDADHPLVRVVARHVLGLLLLIEENLADPNALRRARLALNWLTQRQTAEGAWPLYTVNRGVVSVFSVYPTALAGMALSRGYQVLENPRYKLAASRALDWQKVRPESDSPFHRGLVLAQLLEHYRAVYQIDLLQRAVEQALIIIGSQLPNGSWSDPGPLHSDEHAIIAEALLMLEQALIKAHPRRRRIKASATRAINFLLARQKTDGNFITGVDETLATKVPTFELVLLVRARQAREMAEFDLPITGAIRAMNQHPSLERNLWRGSQDGRFLGMAHSLVWFVTTQTGLPQRRPAELTYRDLAGADSLAADSTDIPLAVPDSSAGEDPLPPSEGDSPEGVIPDSMGAGTANNPLSPPDSSSAVDPPSPAGR